MNPTKLIATYSRVSTSTQEQQETIRTQFSAIRDFAKENGYTIVQDYKDDGWSGDILARPALDQLRMDAKKKIWDAVLFYDPDRLARRYSYQELVMDELRESGIESLFVTIPPSKNSEDRLMYGVRGIFAEYERVKIAERFRIGKVRKAKEGHLLVSEALYGYCYIRKQDKRHGYYKVNPEEARVVKMIFAWITGESMTLRGVVRKLQEIGIKPRKSKRGVWNTSTLSTMLRNKAYIGEAHWGSSYAVIPENPLKKEKYKKIKKTSRKTKPEEEWITIPVPAIIDGKLFAQARSQLEKNFKLCDRNKKNEYLLAGKIYCTCGARRGGEGPQRGKHLYYRCENRTLNFPLSRTCWERGINARVADQMVWERVERLMVSPELLLKKLKHWGSTRETKTKSLLGDAGEMEREIKKLRIEEDRYNKAYGSGLFTMEKLQEYIGPVREKIATLEGQVLKIKQEEGQGEIVMLPNISEVKTFTRAATETLNGLNFEKKRGIVIDTINKVIATQEGLRVDGAIPITINNYVEFKTSYRNSRTAQCRQVYVI